MMPRGWSKQQVSDVLEKVVVPIKPIEGEYYREIGIRSHGKGVFHKEKTTSKDIGNKRVFKVVENAFVVNIVFAWEQAIAKTSIKESGFIASHRFPQFLPKDDKCDIDYLVYFFKTLKGKYLLEFASPGGAGRNKTLGKKEFDSLMLTLPPIKEQQKIAKILSTWDKAIVTTEKLIATSKQQKKALMQQLLTGKKRLLNPETGKAFEGEWEEVMVSCLGTIYSGGTPSTSTKEFWDGGIDWITPTDITKQNSVYINSSVRKISQEGLKNSSAKLVPKGTLLICTRATIGEMAITAHDMCTNQGFKNLVPNKKTNIEFVYYLLTHQKQKLISKSSGSTFLELSKSAFESMAFKIPGLIEQQKIASVFTSTDKEIELLEAKLALLKQEKKALMQQLLTGKRRVKVDLMETV